MKYIVLILFLLMFPIVSAGLEESDFDFLLINSYDWEDVFSGMLYAELTNVPVGFLTSQSQTNDFLDSLNPSIGKILILQSENNRVSPTVARSLVSKGYEIEVDTQSDFTSYLSSHVDVSSIFVVDRSYPANAVALAPYLRLKSSWLVFIDDTNQEEILSLLASSNYQDITYYGVMPENFLNQAPQGKVIDTGNKYRNNLQIVDSFFEEVSVDQVVLTDGSFIERSFFEEFPVILMGTSTVPRQVIDYIVDSPLRFGVVVGADAVDNGLLLKDIVQSQSNEEFTMFAKLAKTNRQLDTPNDITSLDFFYIPNPKISIQVTAIQYNPISKQLELVFANTGDVRTFYSPTIELVVDGETIIVEADEEYYVLSSDRSDTLIFPLDLDPTAKASAKITTVYGDNPESFEFSLVSEFDEVPFITVQDESSIFVSKIKYDASNGAFIVTVINNGSVDAYVDFSFDDLIIGGQSVTISSTDVVRIPAGTQGVIILYAELSEIDIQANAFISYFAKYGQRENVLAKVTSGELPLQTGSLLDYLNKPIVYIPVIVIIVFVILIAIILRSPKTFTCLSCGQEHTTSRKPSHCRSCGYAKFKK